MILNEEEIEYFKQNKHLITSELLDTLRNQGKDGRQIAIEILDLNHESDTMLTELDLTGTGLLHRKER